MNNGHHFRSADVLVGIDNIVDAIEKFIDESKPISQTKSVFGGIC
jgi:hypothetical protein